MPQLTKPERAVRGFLHSQGLALCRSCAQARPAGDFYKDPHGFRGLTPCCKPCRREKQRVTDAAARAADPVGWDAKKAARQREYHQRTRPARALNMRKQLLRKKYGLTLEGFNALVEKQHGRCAICFDKPEGLLHVDHDHSTGKVRALLCGRCNRGIGLFLEDTSRLGAAAAYLESHRLSSARAGSTEVPALASTQHKETRWQ